MYAWRLWARFWLTVSYSIRTSVPTAVKDRNFTKMWQLHCNRSTEWKNHFPSWFWIKEHVSKASEIIILDNKLIIFKKILLFKEREKKIPFSEIENNKLFKAANFAMLTLHFETWKRFHFDSAEIQYLCSKAFQVLIFHKL